MVSDAALLKAYFPALTTKQYNQLVQYGTLLQEWNLRINLISRKDVGQVYLHHILYSMAPAKYISFSPDQTILDVGTGGGLPGLPLAILFPETHFHLIDRTQKKIHAVTAMVSSLNLTNISAEQASSEEHQNKYHFILGRGVTRLEDFIKKVKHLIRFDPDCQHTGGILYLKGGDLETELRNVSVPFRSVPVSAYFKESYFETKKIIHCFCGKWVKEK